jgi:two-component system, chemotaxis family, CheB/CheR fusion protein
MKPGKEQNPFQNDDIADNKYFPVVGVGASAGGLDAFKKLLKEMPEQSGIAWVLVQHLDASHQSLLPDILQKVTAVPVIEIKHDTEIEPDNIYIIPSNALLTVQEGLFKLAPRENHIAGERTMTIDLFFSSLAAAYNENAIGVILSGTATDGTNGLKAIKQHGGITIVQDEASAEYPGMPQSAIKEGVVDFVLTPSLIVSKLIELTKNTNENESDKDYNEQDVLIFQQIIALLRAYRGVDFNYYKQTTIRRRILRRMVLNKKETLDDYLKYLEQNRNEVDLLYQDMLIPVTSFFRDVSIFDTLCESVFPTLVQHKKENGPIRIWVAGCSTGQEAYSIAMCLKEYLGSKKEVVQIFATDLSEPAITKARAGIYSKAEVETVSAPRLERFFTYTQGNYQINKEVRDMCVFAVHNFLKDSPFSKIDFVSCRNVLIYMDSYLQKKALATFHYALNSKGLLLLGKSENTLGLNEFFTPAGKFERIFNRKDVAVKLINTAYLQTDILTEEGNGKLKAGYARTDFQKSADDLLLDNYIPASVVVNDAMDIVHFRGNTTKYLEQSAGKPTHNIFKMAKAGLSFELRNLFSKLKKNGRPIQKENIILDYDNQQQLVTVEITPLPNSADPYYLVVFLLQQHAAAKQNNKSRKKQSATLTSDKDLRIQQLEAELTQLKDDMRRVAEDQEASNEELQSTNEELLSSSEELQSLNEELETSKEELQSTNEELTVVNQELTTMNEQLTAARDYAEAIITTIPQPLLVLDNNLRVKIANRMFYEKFLVNEEQTENRRIYDLGNGQWNIPALINLLESILPQNESFFNYEVEHDFQKIGYRIMLLNAKEIRRNDDDEKLILLSIEDVTTARLAARKIEESEAQFRSLIKAAPVAIGLFMGRELIIQNPNQIFIDIVGKGNSIIGKPLAEAMPELITEGQPFLKILDDVYTTGKQFQTFETLVKIVQQGVLTNRYYDFTYTPLFDAEGKVYAILDIAIDVTQRVETNKKIKESEEQFSTLAESMGNLAWIADGEGWIYWYNKRWYDYTGTTLEEMQGWGWEKVHHPHHKERVVEFVKEAWKKNEPFELTFPLRGGDGEYRWFLTRAFPIADENGKVKRWIGTNTNIDEQKKTTEALYYRKTLLEAHNQANLDGVLLVDTKGNIISYNQRFLDIWNIPLHIIDNKDDNEALAFAMQQLVNPHEYINKVKYLYENPTQTSIDILTFKDGKIIERYGYPAIGNDGVFYAWSWTFRDITEIKKAELALRQSEEHFRQLANLVPGKINEADAAGNVYYYNKAWLDFTGLTLDELMQEGWQKIIHPDELEPVSKQWMECVATGNSIELSLRMQNKEGEYKWHLARAVAIKNDVGEVLKWISTMTEIQSLKEEEERKEDFLKMVSHELKTPVTSIKGYVQLLLSMMKENEQISITPLKTSLERIDSQVLRLSRLITEMLDLSKIELAKLTLQKKVLNLNLLVAETIQDINYTNNTHTILLTEETNVNIFADKDRIGQVIINFITNAIKYSPKQTTIEVKIYAAENNAVAVSVKDEGIGIEKNDQHKIFERFYRAGGEMEKTYGGFGIGLFIASEIIQRHKGSIAVESEKGKGSTFIFMLPVSK